eukprot:9152108-Alexandrium_andersonii.AAC.1
MSRWSVQWASARPNCLRCPRRGRCKGAGPRCCGHLLGATSLLHCRQQGPGKRPGGRSPGR